MKKFNLRSGLMATTTLAGALATTMGVTAFMSTVAIMAPTAAMAQDYTSGALTGTVTADGKAIAGAEVSVTSKALGQTTHLKTSASGGFSTTGLQPGDYDITVTANGYADYHGTAKIVISQEVRFDASLSVTGAAQTVVVKGHRVRQDFTKTTTGITVDLDTLVAQAPVARSITAVANLAPGVVQGNPGFGDVASFGGSSVAENAYYIDGLNITNPDTYVGGARVPFDFYKTVEVKTGGFPAEFGRATGGVLNATTKSGTNDFTFGVHANYQPMGLQNQQLDTYEYTGRYSKTQDNSLSVEAGGPILKDRLFAYGLYQFNDYKATDGDKLLGAYESKTNKDPFMGLKLDGYITPTQHLSFTYFDTTNTEKNQQYAYDGDSTIGDKIGTTNTTTGGRSWVFNYAGKVTDWLSISAAVGDMKDQNNVVPSNTADYYVTDTFTPSCDGCAISTTQPASTIDHDKYERKFWRTDGDMRFEWLGRHHVRFGYDYEKNSMDKIDTLVGSAAPVIYDYEEDPRADHAGEEVLNATYELLGGHVSSQNDAFYVQDSWDVTSKLNLSIGVRDDEFKQFNLSGEQYMDVKNNIGPRLGFSWTPDADGNWKIFGSYGSNYIPPAMNLGFRGKDLYFSEYFSAPAGGFTIDPTTGLPTSTGPAFADPDTGYSSPCPTSKIASAPGLSAAAAGTATCAVYGNGTQEGANSKTAVGLKAAEDDEFILGAQYKANDLWTFGLTATYRNMTHISEDSDFEGAITDYLQSHGLDASQYTSGEISTSYYVWNVGDHDVTVRLKDPLPGETTQRVITLTADELGHYHNAKRTYESAVFDFKRAFDGKWGLQGSYTWSRLYGNYEGTVSSEVGNGVQTDAGATIAWDSPGFEDNATGLLPGNRTHQFKLWGSYAFTPAFLMGFNLDVQSPERFSCLGHHPTDPYAASYGNYSHFCGGLPAPEGKGLKADWTREFDVSMRYTVPQQFSLGGKLILRADIFNLLDYHDIVTRRITYETSGVDTRSLSYGDPTAYNTPRYVRVGFDLTY